MPETSLKCGHKARTGAIPSPGLAVPSPGQIITDDRGISGMGEYRIGVDVGGTKVAYGLFDGQNHLLDRYEHPSPLDIDGPGISDLVIGGIRQVAERNRLKLEDLEGVGVCMPSYILFDEGYIFLTSALTNIRDFAMGPYLEARLPGVAVVLDNDSNCAALAEHRYGAGRGCRDLVYMSVSTGLGSGLILNGELFRGSYGWAGETGHMLITPDQGLECGCRNKGCFMSWSSGRFFPEHARAMGRKYPTAMDLEAGVNGRTLLEACKAGDPAAMAVLEQSAYYIGLCVYNIWQVLNVKTYVFGGGLVHFGDMLFDRVRAVFDRYNHVDVPVDFKTAQLKQDFGIMGAAELARRR